MNKTLTSVALVAALSLPALPAFAQRPERGGGHGSGGGAARQQGGGGNGGGGSARAVERGSGGGGPARTYSAPQAQPRVYSAPQPRENAGAQPRQYSGPQAQPRTYAQPRSYAGEQPRAYPRSQAQPRSYAGPQQRVYSAPQSRVYSGQSRVYSGAQPRYESRGGYVGRAVPRPGPRYDSGRYAAPRSYAYGSYYRGRPNFARPYTRFYTRPYDWRPYRPFYFSRPYYSFRPWTSIGFGLWLGYSVPYPYTYLGTYRPRIYGYVDTSYYSYDQPLSVYGGVSLDIQPSDADVFVDGEYAGQVSNFSPNAEPLTLTPGTHQIAIQCEGFRAMEWDVTIEPGQVIPYRGDMERY